MKDTKDFILDIAYELFLNNNYESVTFTEICKATKFTKGAVYHYFSSKEELFKSVVQKYFINPLTTTYPDDITLEGLIKIKLSEIEFRTQYSLKRFEGKSDFISRHYIHLLFTAYKYYPEFPNIGDRFIATEVQVWKNAITNSIKCNIIRSDFDIEIMALNFIAIIINIIMSIIHNNPKTHLETIKKQLELMYELLKK